MEHLPATRTTNTLTRRSEMVILWSARRLGASYRGTRHQLARYRASEVMLYNDPSIVIDGSFLGGVAYLLTCSPLIVALMTFGLLAIGKIFYYLGHGLFTEVGTLRAKLATRVLMTINLTVFAAITTLLFVSSSPWKHNAYLALIGLLLVETISVLTWYTKWALRDQERNMRTACYETVVMRTGRRYLVAALFVVAQAFAFAFLA